MEFTVLVWDLPGPVHLYSPQCFCLGMEMSILRLHHCIWKQIVCKVSQIHSWKGILPQMIIAWVPFTLDLNEFRWDFGLLGWKWICFVCEKDMNLGDLEGIAFWAELSPPKVHVDALISCILECNYIWR